MTTLTTARPMQSGWGYTLAGLFGRVADWNDARVTRRMLRGLSTRQLDDIGLMRADIEAVAARGLH